MQIETTVVNISKPAKIKPARIEKELNLTFKVDSETWAKFLLKKAMANGLSKEIEAMKENFGFTEKEEMVSVYGLTEEDSVSVPVVNGNGQTIGKVNYSFQPEKVVSAYWQMRIS